MKLFLAGVCLAIFFLRNSAFVIRNAAKSDSDLVSVAVLFREGDRTPSSSFPKDPYFDLKYWPMGFGQLTKRGEMHQYELGQWLRTRYSSFLPQEYLSSDIYVRSTDVDRTLVSASANLAGLYPPVESQVWNSKLLWQPIPVHTIPRDDDQMLYMNSDCSKFYSLYDEQYDADFFANINQQYADFYKEVSELTGWDVTDIDFFGELQGVLYVYANYNNGSYLPSWAKTLDQDKLDYLAGLSDARYTFTDDLKRLGAGPFFDYLISHFNKMVADATSAPKLLMLSGHESTLVAALNSMNLFDYRPPAFASSIIWELRKTEDDVYFVNMYYKRNSTTVVPEELALKGCGFDCEFGNYTQYLEPFTVNMTTWQKECDL